MVSEHIGMAATRSQGLGGEWALNSACLPW